MLYRLEDLLTSRGLDAKINGMDYHPGRPSRTILGNHSMEEAMHRMARHRQNQEKDTPSWRYMLYRKRLLLVPGAEMFSRCSSLRVSCLTITLDLCQQSIIFISRNRKQYVIRYGFTMRVNRMDDS